MSEAGLRPIPWTFQDSALATIWQWTTPHFQATITAEARAYFWELGDLIAPNDGQPRFLAESRATDFDTAERDLREMIGKSYPPHLGYGVYVGSLATTFTIATGERIDFGQFTGQPVVVTVRMPSGADQTLVGHASVVHFELVLESANRGAVKVQPSHIVRIVREGGGTASTAASGDYLGAGRMYRGQITRTCTGTPGFMPNTIDHTGRPCPAHEVTRPRFDITPVRG